MPSTVEANVDPVEKRGTLPPTNEEGANKMNQAPAKNK